jgi:hypothetical protein
MEYQDIQQIWNEYSRKVPSDKITKQQLAQMLSKKFHRRLERMYLGSLYGIFVHIAPLFVYGAFYDTVRHKTLYFVFGLVLLATVMWYLLKQIRIWLLVKGIKIPDETPSSLEQKLTKLQRYRDDTQNFGDNLLFWILAIPLMFIIVDLNIDQPLKKQILIYAASVAYLYAVFKWTRFRRKRFYDKKVGEMIDEVKDLKNADH